MKYAHERLTRVVSVRTLSNTICAAPGITPMDLSEQTKLPIEETMRALDLLLRNKLINWAGDESAPVTAMHTDSEIQLQTITRVTGLDLDRPL